MQRIKCRMKQWSAKGSDTCRELNVEEDNEVLNAVMHVGNKCRIRQWGVKWSDIINLWNVEWNNGVLNAVIHVGN